jgi:hypothetical protein
MVHVPYRGDVPAITDLLGGQVQVYFGTLSGSVEYISSKHAHIPLDEKVGNAYLFGVYQIGKQFHFGAPTRASPKWFTTS